VPTLVVDDGSVDGSAALAEDFVVRAGCGVVR
jgi:hypothetical protein